MPAKVLNEKEVKRILAVIHAERHAARNRCAFMLSLLAGLRAIEIASLTIADVYDDFDEVKDEIVLSADKTKGNKSRNIIISTKLAKELKQYYSSIKYKDKHCHLIQSQKNRHFSANTLVQLFQRIYKQASVDNASSHSGRRTFITELASKGVSARVLQKLAGHSSLATTQRYIEVNDNMLKSAVELL